MILKDTLGATKSYPPLSGGLYYTKINLNFQASLAIGSEFTIISGNIWALSCLNWGF